MKRQLTFLGIVMMWILVMVTTPILADDVVMRYETKFNPYFIGRQQKDSLIVVNHSKRYHLSVVAMAYDPFTGEHLDAQEARIPAGEGARMVITETYPAPHASQLIVQVKVVPDGSGAFVGDDGPGTDVISDPPFSITRVLTTHRDATLLQIIGDPTFQNGD